MGDGPVARSGSGLDTGQLFAAAETDFARYEVVKDLIDECIDLSLNYRQSGHPGGSRSKVHMMVALLLSGAMRWDVLRPWRRFGDRFVLSAGHTVPLVYATLAVLNEAMRARYERSGESSFAFPDDGRWALTWEWLLRLRRHGGLPGHAEMEGRTLFLKYNTGPSGHGMPPAAGEALAFKPGWRGRGEGLRLRGRGRAHPRLGARDQEHRVGPGPGQPGLHGRLERLRHRPAARLQRGGRHAGGLVRAVRLAGHRHRARHGVGAGHPDRALGGVRFWPTPTMAWFVTQKGRGYGKVDAASHGTPFPMNAPQFWDVRKQFMARYGVTYEGVDSPAPADPEAVQAQAAANLGIAMSVLRRDEELVTWLSDRLLAIASTVPSDIDGFRLGRTEVFSDRRIFDVSSYPDSMWKKPGEKAPNRAGLAAWGAYVNTLALRDYGRPLFIAASADLAESTNIAGFGQDFGGLPGTGWYERSSNPYGALLPTEITEFTNAGLVCGLATVNLSPDPFAEFDGFWGACSTYGSFSYLKYGPMRLFSQLAQDSELKVGKVLWIAGHSGPETAEDSRTHFGIFSIGVTQLFPEGHVIDLHPWEYNEVPVMLGAAFGLDVPIVALHLTRPPVEIPDREALGIPSHLAAARGAYVLRDYRGLAARRDGLRPRDHADPEPGQRAACAGRGGINVKIVAALSPQLFARQPLAYRESVAGPSDRLDAMVITNGAFKLMREWADGPLAREYSLSSDWDDRWRTGGSVAEVIEEAHLDEAHILAALERFAA